VCVCGGGGGRATTERQAEVHRWLGQESLGAGDNTAHMVGHHVCVGTAMGRYNREAGRCTWLGTAAHLGERPCGYWRDRTVAS
jgi:hypothetical protein